MISLNNLYKKLLVFHGPQGWWPIVDPESGISVYRKRSRYSEEEIFEIFIGAILTQGVAWKNVEKAVFNLKQAGILSPEGISKISVKKLGRLIKPSGYFNQKAIKIKNFMKWFGEYGYLFKMMSRIKDIELRKSLLSINGIGPETADSMLNYGLGRKIFVIDAYTKRLISRLGHMDEESDYHSVQDYFLSGFRGDTGEYREFHSLIVAHGSAYCRKKPLCLNCPLSKACKEKSA